MAGNVEKEWNICVQFGHQELVEWNGGMEYWNDSMTQIFDWNTGMTWMIKMFDKYHPPLSTYKYYTMRQLHTSDLSHAIASWVYELLVW